MGLFDKLRFKGRRVLVVGLDGVPFSLLKMLSENPGKHNIYGFVDRNPGSMDVFIPTSRDMAGKTLWEILSQAGKRVVVINVPVTFPPREVNGILISGFLCPNIDKIAHPKELAAPPQGTGCRPEGDGVSDRCGRLASKEVLR
jgi:predicted AlkP superfamily phosphohydrolase/phosphomutase